MADAQKIEIVPIDAHLEVLDISHSDKMWTLTVVATNTGIKPQVISVDYLYLNDDTVETNQCVETHELEAGQSQEIVGCFIVEEGLVPTGIDIIGEIEERTLPTHILAFNKDLCDTTTDGASCQEAESVQHMLDNTPDSLLATASYDWDTFDLVVKLSERVNRFLVNTDSMTISDGICSFDLSNALYDPAEQEYDSLTIRLDHKARNMLAGMANPTLHMMGGSIYHINGTQHVPISTPLHTYGIPPEGFPCPITYGIDHSLQVWLITVGVDVSHAATIMEAVHDGFEAWSGLNPALQFAQTDYDPDISIQWILPGRDHIGLACVDCIGYDAYMDIAIHDEDCNGVPVAFGHGIIRNTVAHELGHNLGLLHHADESHLMYGDNGIRTGFDTLGYSVPEQLPEYFVGEEELLLELDVLDAKIIQLQKEADAFADLYVTETSGNTIYFSSDRLADRYNIMADRINNNIREYNMLVDRLNCMKDVDEQT